MHSRKGLRGFLFWHWKFQHHTSQFVATTRNRQRQKTKIMGRYPNAATGDLDKLQEAFREITSAFGSFENLLEAFGLSHLPQAQRYGIMFGILVFGCTITAVLGLLIFGGTFKRLAEEMESAEPTLLSATAARQRRALLLEGLLEGSSRMLRNYPPEPLMEELTNLTKLLMNESPDEYVVVDDFTNTDKKTKERYIPPFFEENYLVAYRRCQDRPGGTYDDGFIGCSANCGRIT
jgi:hypothetical protein